MKRNRVEEAINSCIKDIVPVRDIPPAHKNLPIIVNMVATVKLLEDDETFKFPLESIAMTLGGLSQFAPCKFAADILRLRDSTTDTTALVFRSGKIVIVRGLTKEHVRYCMQMFRSIIEKIKCVMQDDDGNMKSDEFAGQNHI